MGDPWDFFFLRVTTGGGVRRVVFCRKQRETVMCKTVYG